MSTQQSSKKTLLGDKFLIGEELGRGAYGQVFKGMDTSTGDVVAIKQIGLGGVSQANLQGVMGEIDLLKTLNHNNIVKYIGSFKTRNHLYIILEFMENGALSSVIKPARFGVFPETLVAIYIAQVLQGLAYLHDQGVVHRDIKGANILTTKDVSSPAPAQHAAAPLHPGSCGSCAAPTHTACQAAASMCACVPSGMWGQRGVCVCLHGADRQLFPATAPSLCRALSSWPTLVLQQSLESLRSSTATSCTKTWWAHPTGWRQRQVSRTQVQMQLQPLWEHQRQPCQPQPTAQQSKAVQWLCFSVSSGSLCHQKVGC